MTRTLTKIDGIKVEPQNVYLVERTPSGHLFYEFSNRETVRFYLEKAKHDRNIDKVASYENKNTGHRLVMFSGSYGRLSSEDVAQLSRPTGVTGLLQELATGEAALANTYAAEFDDEIGRMRREQGEWA